MRLPRCLTNADVMAWIEAMDEQLRASGGTGSFAIRWHYADGEPRVVRIEAPEQTFVLPRALTTEAPTPRFGTARAGFVEVSTAERIVVRTDAHAMGCGKDLTPGDSRS